MVIKDHCAGECSWCTGYGGRYTPSSEEFEVTRTSLLLIVDIADQVEEGWRVDPYITRRSRK
jgi:hypothetical protein